MRYSRIMFFPLAVLLADCRLSKAPETAPLALSQRVAWMGNFASTYSDSIPDSIRVGADSNGDGIPLRIHRLEFTALDSVRLTLTEYRNPACAYAAFQRSASSAELGDGFYRDRNGFVFHQRNYIGDLEFSRPGAVSANFLKENLSFVGEELFSKPEEFSTFPLLGRIPNSERIIRKHFLGRNWQGPVFTMAYRCHSDTGTAFRAGKQNSDSIKTWLQVWQGKTDTLDWGREIRFQGMDEFRRPLIFWFFSEEIMGFAGCFDPPLAQEYAQKMEKTAIFWTKP